MSAVKMRTQKRYTYADMILQDGSVVTTTKVVTRGRCALEWVTRVEVERSRNSHKVG